MKSSEGQSPKQRIYFIFLDEVEAEVCEAIRRAVQEWFGHSVAIMEKRLDQRFALNPQRGQYYSTRLLEKLRRGLIRIIIQ